MCGANIPRLALSSMDLSIVPAAISVVTVLMIADLALFESRMKKQSNERRDASDLDGAHRSGQGRPVTHSAARVCR